MAETITRYNSLTNDLLADNINVVADTIKVMLVSMGYTFSASHAKRSSITNEASNNAGSVYVTGGATLTSKTVGTVGPGVFDAADVNWANSHITAFGAVIYKSRGGASSADELIAYVSFGENKTSENGNFTITWNAAGIMSLT